MIAQEETTTNVRDLKVQILIALTNNQHTLDQLARIEAILDEQEAQ